MNKAPSAKNENPFKKCIIYFYLLPTANSIKNEVQLATSTSIQKGTHFSLEFNSFHYFSTRF